VSKHGIFPEGSEQGRIGRTKRKKEKRGIERQLSGDEAIQIQGGTLSELAKILVCCS